jgi:uncharacterized protein involved in oxidation of intracellular sulfur
MEERITIIINDPPYGTEKPWNAIRLANSLLIKHIPVNIFLVGDGASIARRGQQTPKGFYNLEELLAAALSKGAAVKV